MEPNAENSCRRDAIKEKLRQNFDGKIVSTVVQMTKLLLKKACRM